MYHELFCVGRFSLLSADQADLARPATKWLTLKVRLPMSREEFASFCAERYDAAGEIFKWAKDQGVWYDEDGYLVLDDTRITPIGKSLVHDACLHLGCDVTDCLGRICTKNFVRRMESG